MTPYRNAWDALKERMETAGWTATEVLEQIEEVEDAICDLESLIDVDLGEEGDALFNDQA
jgi:hypothetical protein